MSTLEKTKLGWELPHPNNTLDVDVVRIRNALNAADAAVTAARADAKTQADANAKTASDAIAALQKTVTDQGKDVSALKTGKVASVNGISGESITLKPENLSLGPANGATSCTLTYDSSGRISKMTESILGQTATTTITYDASGRVSSVATVYMKRTRTEIYAYDAATGRVTGITATEVQA